MSSGYRDCACRDCFDIAVGEKGALCGDCEDAGCSADGDEECQRDDAYDFTVGDDEFHGCAATREACQPEGDGDPCSCSCHDQEAN